jgi:hypothetical protein
MRRRSPLPRKNRERIFRLSIFFGAGYGRSKTGTRLAGETLTGETVGKNV